MPFLLAGRDSAWRVLTGAVDVFLVDVRDGQGVGARWHVWRAAAGEWLFGMPEPASGQAGLLACPLPGTRVELAGARDARALEAWVNRLSQGIVREALPTDVVALDLGETHLPPGSPQRLRARGPLCWVRHAAGESAFLGRRELPLLDGSGWFPLSNAAWLEIASQASLSAIATEEWLRQDPRREALDRFHQVALSVLCAARAAGADRESQRRAVSARIEAAVVGGALRRLSAPGGDPGHAVDESAQDPLFLACAKVGQELGIRFQAPRGNVADPGIDSIARASSVRVRRVALRADWWRQNAGPLVVLRAADNHPMALVYQRGHYRLYDPADGQSRRVSREVASSLESFAWSFYRPFPDHKLGLSDLLLFGLRQAGPDLATIVLTGVASGLLAALAPAATGVVFDIMIPGADRTGLTTLVAFLAAAACATALFQLSSHFAVLRLEGRMEGSVQAAVWDRLLSLPVPFFRDYAAGDLASRSLAISQIRRVLTGPALHAMLAGVFSMFSFALMFYYSWQLALLGTVLSVVAFLVPAGLGYLQVRRYRPLYAAVGKVSGIVLQLLTGISKLRVAGKELRAFAVWAGEFSNQKQRASRVRIVSDVLVAFLAMYPVLCTAAIFYVNASRLRGPLGPALSTGAFLAFHAAFFQFLNAGLAMSSALVSVLGVVPLFERARPILETSPEADAGRGEPGELTGSIEFNHLYFRYRPELPLVLHDLSLSLRPGEFVALVGASGCGKSTLFRLLLGFEKPESGAIYLDGQDLAGLHPQAVRRQIGVVLQNGRLQTGDIFNNIVGSRPLTMEDAWEAVRLAGLEDEIRAMPMGMHTVIGESGGLSGGQRQRLMIARAIAGRPRILLFDEATSALDNRTQAIVTRSLDALQATRLVIAHRLSTILHADRIVVIDQGRIVETGTYQQLLERGGLFANLARRQLT